MCTQKKKNSLDARSAIPISLDCHSSMILDNLALPTSATGSDIRDTTILKTQRQSTQCVYFLTSLPRLWLRSNENQWWSHPTKKVSPLHLTCYSPYIAVWTVKDCQNWQCSREFTAGLKCCIAAWQSQGKMCSMVMISQGTGTCTMMH